VDAPEEFDIAIMPLQFQSLKSQKEHNGTLSLATIALSRALLLRKLDRSWNRSQLFSQKP